ncbi:hypothetical protein GFY24_06160 [Nocardia sp. SYP-A9097]|nr:hypothetical protein [Nocardia sp. SYP-A9097]
MANVAQTVRLTRVRSTTLAGMTAQPHSDEPIRTRLVSLPMPPAGGFTAEDLPRLIEVVDGRFELLDGDVVMMAPATHWHNEVSDLLKHGLRTVAPRPFVIATEQGINLGGSVPEPDVLVVSRTAVQSDSLVFEP